MGFATKKMETLTTEQANAIVSEQLRILHLPLAISLAHAFCEHCPDNGHCMRTDKVVKQCLSGIIQASSYKN